MKISLYPILHMTYSQFVEDYTTYQSFGHDFTNFLNSLEDRLTHEWNVIWKCIYLKRQTNASYSTLPRYFVLAMISLLAVIQEQIFSNECSNNVQFSLANGMKPF